MKNESQKPILPNRAQESRGPALEFQTEIIVAHDALQPVLFRSSSGDLLACGLTFYYHDQGPKLVLGEQWRYPGIARWIVSHDQGATWQEVPWVGEFGHGQDVVASGVELPDGRFLLYEFYTLPGDGPGHFRVRYWVARDGFRVFEPGPLLASISVLPEVVVPNYDDNGNQNVAGPCLWRSIVGLPSGELLATAYTRFAGDNLPTPYCPRMCKSRSILLVSQDQGRSWNYRSTIATLPETEEGANETSMVRVTHGAHQGRLVCHMRTGNLGSEIYQAQSEDDGKTWSRAKPLSILGVDPCLMALSDGTLVCTFGTRLGDKSVPGWKHGNKIVISHDAGDTWSAPIELPYDSKAPGAYQNPQWLDSSYTALVELSPGTLLMAYEILGGGQKGNHGKPWYLACRRVLIHRHEGTPT